MTDKEQTFLVLLNEARRDPGVYALVSGIPVAGYASSPALIADERLADCAKSWSKYMAQLGRVEHGDVGVRLGAHGIPFADYGDSVAGGPFGDPAKALNALLFDNGVHDLGHRRHLLAVDPRYKSHTHVGVGHAVDTAKGTHYWTITTIAPVAVDPKRTFVANLYHDLLGRAASEAEIAFWATGKMNETVLRGIAGSPEHLRYTISEWYRKYLRREPDKEGLEHWVTLLISGRSESNVLAEILLSAEYQALPLRGKS